MDEGRAHRARGRPRLSVEFSVRPRWRRTLTRCPGRVAAGRWGDHNKPVCDPPAEKRPAARVSARPARSNRQSFPYLLNVLAIIPCTSAEAFTIRAMLAAW